MNKELIKNELSEITKDSFLSSFFALEILQFRCLSKVYIGSGFAKLQRYFMVNMISGAIYDELYEFL